MVGLIFVVIGALAQTVYGSNTVALAPLARVAVLRVVSNCDIVVLLIKSIDI